MAAVVEVVARATEPSVVVVAQFGDYPVCGSDAVECRAAYRGGRAHSRGAQ